MVVTNDDLKSQIKTVNSMRHQQIARSRVRTTAYSTDTHPPIVHASLMLDSHNLSNPLLPRLLIEVIIRKEPRLHRVGKLLPCACSRLQVWSHREKGIHLIRHATAPLLHFAHSC